MWFSAPLLSSEDSKSSTNPLSVLPCPSNHIGSMDPSQELVNIGERNFHESLLIQKNKPFKVGPSSVLDRVKSFLPQMEVANKQLEERIADGKTVDLDIENVDNCEGPIIEMNLALCARDENSDEEESEEDESDSDADIQVELEHTKSKNEDESLLKLKIPGRGKKPKDGRTLIEMMPGESTNTKDCFEKDKT
ncbi:NOP protein chaperone 1-like [Lytechinus pictus]|uniref:NOP protein chaperone 1-like n=1 Tax=Lytechinus pictus TaxID=7653 RepID=UPI0030B9ED44